MINQRSYEVFGMPLYTSAEDVVYNLLEAITKLNKKIIKDPDNIAKYKAEYEKEIQKIADNFETNWQKWANEDIPKAYLAGLKSTESQLKNAGQSTKITNTINNGSFMIQNLPPIPPIPPIPGQVLGWFEGFENHTQFMGVFRNAAYYSLEGQHLQILRKADDIFRQTAIMAGEANYKETDIFTRRKLSQSMLDEYAKKGIQTVTYKNGAKYSIDTYCEMVGRTVTGRAAMQANLNRCFESGYNLVVVSAHFRACDLCTPYEGVTLSIEPHPTYESVDDAITQGLFHPNCAHSISPFFEGITEKSTPRVHYGEQKLIDEYGYDEAQKISYIAQQKQRYIERNIRKWKRQEVTALDKAEKIRAKNKINEWQKKQREHLDQNSYLRRKYEREQIRKAH